jgi:hypothetical protein
MAVQSWGRRIVPVVLGVGMLALVLAAALSPNSGAVPAQTGSGCQYGACPASTSSFPWWIVGVIAVLVAAALVALLLLARRRRPPATGAPEAWAPPAGTAGAAAAGASPPPPGPGASPAYLETPEDVGASMPAVGAAAAVGAGAGAAAGAAAAEDEPDIDSLMAELDKISGEILKKAPKSGSGGSAGAELGEDAGK